MFIFFALPILIVLAIICFFALPAFVRKHSNEQEVYSMLRQVYLYAIALITLVMSIGGGIAIFMNTADIVSPTVYTQTFEDYKYMQTETAKENKDAVIKTNDELEEDYKLMVAAEKEQQKERAVSNLIKSFGWILIPFPIFLYFQRRINQERKQFETN